MSVRLNGWHRLGIVASIIWFFAAGIYAYNAEEKSILDSGNVLIQACIDEHHGDDPNNMCLKMGEDRAVALMSREWLAGGFVALVPLPLAWGFVYLVLFVVRWVKRGFEVTV